MNNFHIISSKYALKLKIICTSPWRGGIERGGRARVGKFNRIRDYNDQRTQNH